MTVVHATVKVPGQQLFAVLDWNADHVGATIGSLPFVGAGFVIREDNVNLFWDNANKRLGIGTASPNATLNIIGTVNIGPALAGFTNVYEFVVNTPRGGIILNRDHATDEAFFRLTNNNAGSGGQIRGLSSGGIKITNENSVRTFSTITNPATDEITYIVGTGKSQVGLGYTSSAGVDNPCIMAADGAGNLDRIFQRQTSTGDVYIGDIDPNNGDVRFRANGANVVIFEVGGNVGIGTTLPQAHLHVGDQATNYVTFSATGDQVFVGSSGLPFGEIYAHSVVVALTSVAQNDWDQILAFDTNGESNNTTPDQAQDHITITKAGKYLVSFQWSGYSAAVPHDWDFHISKNNNAVQFNEITQHQRSATAARLYSVSATAIITCAVNDTIELWVKRTSAGNNIVLTTTACNITIMQIGG